MKNYVTFFLILFTFQLNSQETEFKVYSNGFIYSPKSMSKLTGIVDSLNLKYKSCDLNKKFHSKFQTVGYVLHLDKGNIKQAVKDINSQMTFEDFKKKYPKSKIKKKVVIVKFKYQNYKNEDVVEFSEISLNDDSSFEIRFNKHLNKYDKSLKNKWLLRHFDKNDYQKESLSAFYFPRDFNRTELPLKYQRMIGYADCLIDTTSLKFNKDAKSGYLKMPKEWQNFSITRKKVLLEKLRNTKVYGSCSMDNSPRVHALNIALLSAETINWEVFLRAHLDIMNDRFERASDGNYAWAQRKTYIKELEHLNINVLDLIIGITLRADNASKNHYNGSISRIGRAISESNNLENIQNTILEMIKNPELDNYNRILSFYLYLNYNYHLKDEKTKKQNIVLLKKAIQELPDYISSKINLD